MDRASFAYIDEYGNTDLETDKEGATDYFIVSAVLVSESKQNKLEKDVEALRKKYFQTGEIKSSGVGNKHSRRAKILNAVNELDFKFYALCVDKNRIKKDSGLRFKKSFLKYVNGKLYSLLFSSFLDIHIFADEHGSEEFKKSFRSYIENTHKPDLLYQTQFDLVNSKNEILVQLSDFIVGSIAKAYEGKASPELKEAYISFLRNKALSIDEWPTKYQTYYPKDKTTDEFSQLIYQFSLAQAELYIEQHEQSADYDTSLRVATLRHLVFHSRMVDRHEYVLTHQIIEYLTNAGFEDIPTQAIRSKIIAPIRDSEVLITSSNKGYKIPCNFSDMEEFVERVNSIVTPLLGRLGKARKNLQVASQGEIDILKGPNYPHLVKFLEVLEQREKQST